MVDQNYTPQPGAMRLRFSERSVLAIYTLAILTSAFLVFSVQPMFTKMVLPSLGGSPSVWSVSMVFFQAALLGGYAYAHALIRWLDPRKSAWVHFVLLGLASLTLPISLADGWGRPPVDGLPLWLLGLYTVSIGLPFFVMAANAPLLQAWFARTGHPHAADPYFLYAASNVGSFGALLSYPFLIEPALTLDEQSLAWSGGFLAFAALALCAGAALRRKSCPASEPEQPANAADAPPVASPVSWAERGKWTLFAFFPSAALVAVTAHISMDVASAPLIWVLPLALFLLTFVLVFRDRPAIPTRLTVPLQHALTIFACFAGFTLSWPAWASIAVHLLLFFTLAFNCHLALYRSRPASEHLTELYLFMSVGGVLGGLFAGLAAPHLFDQVTEYPLLVVGALWVTTLSFRNARKRHPLEMWLSAYLASGLLLALVIPALNTFVAENFYVILLLLVIALLVSYPWPTMALTSAALLLLLNTGAFSGKDELHAERNFFGVHRVAIHKSGEFKVYKHGTTYHGAQRLDQSAPGDPPPDPVTYYNAGGPIARAIAARQAAKPDGIAIGIIGLGTGSLACHKRPQDTLTFFEIDPVVAKIAKDPEHFRFLSECAPEAAIILGDARLTLTDQPAARFDVLVLDAFSSDAIPTHLLTTEAMELYADKVAPDGLIVTHISNRHLDLTGIVSAIGNESGLSAWLKRDDIEADDDDLTRTPSIVMALARKPVDIAGLTAADPGWERQRRDPAIRPWTDQYSNILSVLLVR